MINEKAFRYFGFDLDKAIKYTSSKAELELTLKTFAKCYEKNQRDIVADYEMGMYAEYATHVNSLKNNLNAIGLNNLYKVADKCEEMGMKYSKNEPNAREAAEFEKTNQILLQKYKDAVAFINEQFEEEETDSHEGKLVNNKKVVNLLDSFISACEDFDDEKAKRSLDEIYKYRIDIIARNHIEIAQSYIEEFEYEDAVLEAKEARKKIK